MSDDRFEGLEFLKIMSPIAFQRIFVDWTGSVNSALMLSQLAYWTQRIGWDRWIYKTTEEWQQELGLTLKEQQNARKLLREAGLLIEKRAGLPCRLYFKIDRRGFEKRQWLDVTKGRAHMPDGDGRSAPKDNSTDKTTSETTTSADRVPRSDGEKFLKGAAKYLYSFFCTMRTVKHRRSDLKSWEKRLQWLLLKDLAGDKDRLKHVIKVYATSAHDKYTPKVFSAFDFRAKFLKIEAWTNKHVPPKPKEEYDYEIVSSRVVR